MLHLSHATLAFGDRILFSNLDLKVDQGQLVGITGESGCGKTSLLRAILGFVPLTSGTIEVCGLPLDAHHIHDIRRRTAYVPQELQPPADTGRDLLRLTHDLEANRSFAAAPSILASLALDPSLLSLEASKLSGGQRQRLLLAAALSLPKPLLLLDEPSSALDEESTQRVAHAIISACRDERRAALVVSHDPVLLSFCDKTISL
ncbi:MAG: ATP-binding cassette domain-containing protein [Bacteroidaceae bacterium]|nr:ATP-binding cassette domain-containing protein [Bacteroidaceae bacterium]